MMKIYTHIAKLFTYPTSDFRSVTAQLMVEFRQYGQSAVDEFLPVALHFTSKPTNELQEYYIRTFDVNAACYLDIGYVLFGEESKRGQFLLNMKNEQLKAGNECGTEFADHLPNVLTLLPKIGDHLFREELVVSMVLPALRHMLENFRTEDNSYRGLLKLLVRVLETDFKDSEFVPYQINEREIECAGAYSCGMDFTKLKSKKF
jgi:nitrate reductase assembly molybdenum cofactor insertion protein NarJ